MDKDPLEAVPSQSMLPYQADEKKVRHTAQAAPDRSSLNNSRVGPSLDLNHCRTTMGQPTGTDARNSLTVRDNRTGQSYQIPCVLPPACWSGSALRRSTQNCGQYCFRDGLQDDQGSKWSRRPRGERSRQGPTCVRQGIPEHRSYFVDDYLH